MDGRLVKKEVILIVHMRVAVESLGDIPRLIPLILGDGGFLVVVEVEMLVLMFHVDDGGITPQTRGCREVKMTTWNLLPCRFRLILIIHPIFQLPFDQEICLQIM